MYADDWFTDTDTARTSSPLSVSQLTLLIKNDLENKYPDVIVEGEISNCKVATSGHLYFSLKDDKAVLQAVMFRRDMLSLSFIPRDGMKVLARGGISVYAGRGQYQLVARTMRVAGLGDILALLEERKQKLAKEGLFDQARKKAIPAFPRRIGVITSATGAAIRDIINVLRRRNPKVHIILLPTVVQGEEAAASIAARIRQANLWNIADVLIVGRGGGSIEDLLPFSEEIVVRAIAASRIPVISAVGHETDWALSDYAADLRAPTPSAAAEMASKDLSVVHKEIEHFEMVLAQSMRQRIEQARQRLALVSPRNMESLLIRRHMLLMQQFDAATEAIEQGMRSKVDVFSHRIALAANAIELSNPKAIMKRGFSIVRKNSAIIRSAETIKPGEEVHISFYKGQATATVTGTHDEDGRSKHNERL